MVAHHRFITQFFINRLATSNYAPGQEYKTTLKNEVYNCLQFLNYENQIYER